MLNCSKHWFFCSTLQPNCQSKLLHPFHWPDPCWEIYIINPLNGLLWFWIVVSSILCSFQRMIFQLLLFENLMNYSWKIHEFCSWTSIKSTWTLHECAWTLNGTVHESNSSWIISSWTFLFMNSSWTNVHAFLKSKSWAIFMNFSWIFSWTLNGTVHENCCSWILHDLVIMNISWIIHE